MKLLYYPGCSVKRNAIEYEESTLAVLEKIGVEVKELDKWYCCGVMYSLSSDDLIRHLGAVRTLVKTQVESRSYGSSNLLVLCPMCFNVLKRVDKLLKSDPDKLETISKFMDEEERYQFGVNVLHLLEILVLYRDRIRESVLRKPDGLKIACYYGCTVLRPKDIGVDNPEDPRIMDEIVATTGAEVIHYPFKSECCGAYQSLLNREAVVDKSSSIIREAAVRGANVLLTICPLCHYNLRLALESMKRPPEITIAYLSEYLAYVMGLDNVVSKDVKEFFDRVLSKEKPLEGGGFFG